MTESARITATCPACASTCAPDDSACPACRRSRPENGWNLVAPDVGDVASVLGLRLGKRYTFDYLDGQHGGYARYRARSQTDGDVWFHLLSAPSDPAWSRRFHKDARASQQIDDPRVASVIDFGQLTPGLVYVVLPVVAGATLAELLEQAPLPTARAMRLFAEFADALRVVQRAGLALRWLGPTDVVLIHDAAGDESVSVPGIDCILGPLVREVNRRYAPPELAAGAAPDALSHQFALGMIILEAFTGLGSASPGSGVGRQDVPSEVEQILKRMISANPRDRFPALGPVVATLRRSDQGPLVTMAPTSAPPPVPTNLKSAAPFAVKEGVKETPPTAPGARKPEPARPSRDEATPPPVPSTIGHTVTFGGAMPRTGRDTGGSTEKAVTRSTGPRGPIQAPPATSDALPPTMMAMLLLIVVVLILMILVAINGLRGPTVVQIPAPTVTVAPTPAAAPEPPPRRITQVEPADPEPAPDPAPAPTPAPAMVAPVPAPEVTPAPAVRPAPVPAPAPDANFSIDAYAGRWRGLSLEVPVLMSLVFDKGGSVAGSLRLEGSEEGPSALVGTWKRSGSAVVLDMKGGVKSQIRYEGTLDGDRGGGKVTIEGTDGTESGSWKVLK